MREWDDRITARRGCPGEIVIRVPHEDDMGNRIATNYIITKQEAKALVVDITESL